MIKQEKFEITIVGITPLIIQNAQSSNPLSPYSKRLKEITSKRKKTDEDYEKILTIAWEAALYWSESLGLYMPCENLNAMMLKAARSHKMGPKMSAVSFSEPIGYPIITKNHKDLKALKEDPDNKFVKMVTIQRSKTLSCRPIFREWKINFAIITDPNTIDANEVKTILNTIQICGGLGVWRPTSPTPGSYGKFKIEKFLYIDYSGKKNELTI